MAPRDSADRVLRAEWVTTSAGWGIDCNLVSLDPPRGRVAYLTRCARRITRHYTLEGAERTYERRLQHWRQFCGPFQWRLWIGAEPKEPLTFQRTGRGEYDISAGATRVGRIEHQPPRYSRYWLMTLQFPDHTNTRRLVKSMGQAQSEARSAWRGWHKNQDLEATEAASER